MAHDHVVLFGRKMESYVIQPGTSKFRVVELHRFSCKQICVSLFRTLESRHNHHPREAIDAFSYQVLLRDDRPCMMNFGNLS
jgi:hypothetical protein